MDILTSWMREIIDVEVGYIVCCDACWCFWCCDVGEEQEGDEGDGNMEDGRKGEPWGGFAEDCQEFAFSIRCHLIGRSDGGHPSHGHSWLVAVCAHLWPVVVCGLWYWW